MMDMKKRLDHKVMLQIKADYTKNNYLHYIYLYLFEEIGQGNFHTTFH
jgi:hypothetical protein